MKSIAWLAKPTIVAIAVFLAGCSGNQQPLRYTGIGSSAQMTPNNDASSDRIPFKYAAPVDWKKYTSMIIEPVALYSGSDNQFGDLSTSDRQQLAAYMQTKFEEALRPRFKAATASAPETLRLKLTLTGAETTTQVVGTFTKFDLAGGPYNIVQSIRGQKGMFSGSVSYAVEIYDSTSNRLLHAYVAKQYPNAMNVSASIGALSAAEVGIDKGAEELANSLK
ncbi:putative lipoprotein [Dickeya chrysanthemi Ech1591]|uniref:Putative lipoprotein n=1 Tax=Dickeya chrysanthemi (strain Ech1591) TaxID=561229 RepID=C6CIB0_DICC1|nr:DUF3313 domain-containing protein [Dickeya chrysanthemi]ACT06958.1 putative lipoprotein [Dickeya chrysanthemi Ech1591]